MAVRYRNKGLNLRISLKHIIKGLRIEITGLLIRQKLRINHELSRFCSKIGKKIGKIVVLGDFIARDLTFNRYGKSR
jgi:hypothetical protein